MHLSRGPSMAQRYRDLRGDSLARTLFLQLPRHDCQLLLQFRHFLSSITSFVGAGWSQNIETRILAVLTVFNNLCPLWLQVCLYMPGQGWGRFEKTF